MVLPPIEECLFGASRTCPSLKEDNDEDDDDEDSNGNGFQDSISRGHWGEAESQHDVDLPMLRKIASQGIMDEGSFRAIAWRVLLQYVPTKDISTSWKRDMPPQRALYASFVSDYFIPSSSLDPGEELVGNHSKKLQTQRQREQFEKVQRLDYESSDNNDDDHDDHDDENELNRSKSNDSHGSLVVEEDHKQQQQQSPPPTTILDQLPPKFKEQWKKTGISIDASNKNTQATSMALGINQLVIPQLLLDYTDQDDHKEKEEDDEDDPNDNQDTNADHDKNAMEEAAGAQAAAVQRAFDDLVEHAQMLEEIRKDVVRTHPDLFFFLEPQKNLGLRRYAALERILFVWAKLNKGVRYVQGMNEIVGTLYYVLANDVNADWAQHAEADTYFLFNLLMTEMRDVYVPDLDQHITGIQGRISNMNTLLSTHDPEVQEHLQELGIDASFYAVRWLTTLLSREFLLPDTIRLWDSMFASTHKENFMRYVCGTMVLLVREDLLKGDFSSNLRLLQRYPPSNVDQLLESSRSLWIYESQITLACHKGGISLHQALHTIHPPPSIIMAFGLRGGVAPTLTDSIEQAATLAVQSAKDNVARGEGILGLGMRRKARGLWNKWKEEPTAATAIPEPPAAEPVTETKSPAPRRAWNREASPSNAPAMASPPPSSRIWNREGSNGSANKTTAAPPAVAAPVPSTHKLRLWNRGNLASEVAAITTTTPLAEPTRSRVWNRSKSNDLEYLGSGDEISKSPKEQALDMTEITTAVDKASISDHGDTNAVLNVAQRSSRKEIMEILS